MGGIFIIGIIRGEEWKNNKARLRREQEGSLSGKLAISSSRSPKRSLFLFFFFSLFISKNRFSKYEIFFSSCIHLSVFRNLSHLTFFSSFKFIKNIIIFLIKIH